MQVDSVRTPYINFLELLNRPTDRLTEEPFPEEIFGVEQLEHYATYLARELTVDSQIKKGRSLVPELRESENKLLSAYLSLAEAIRNKQAVSPAAEWFVDNFHIVEEQLKGIKRDLPNNYYYELPKLTTTQLKGYPRVYAIALAFIAHTDSRLDVESLRRFLKSFQQIAPLCIGELWAVAITLRIALIQHLTPLALRIVSARNKREEANHFADKILQLTALPETQSEQLINLLRMELGSSDKLDRAFIVQLIQRLRDQDPNVFPAFEWLELQLSRLKTSTQKVTELEHHRQATAQVTVGNIISSLRLLSSLDWRDFFESVSLVDPILAKDPAQVYSKMNFATRDSYRHSIERLAKNSSKTELQIAGLAIEEAEKFLSQNLDSTERERLSHIGFYLVGEGLRSFEKKVGYSSHILEKITRIVKWHPTFLYLGILTSLTILFLSPTLWYAWHVSNSVPILLGIAFIALLPASELAVSVLNHYLPFFIRPKPLPRIDTEKGVPENSTTMVIIPTLLTNENSIFKLLEDIEVHYLANQDPNIYFAILSDFTDSPTQTTAKDTELLSLIFNGIRELNLKYFPSSEERFFLFHRKRQWNESEGKWLGYERKRGKLEEFNHLLRGATHTSFTTITAPASLLPKIKYVITLDSDTKLPRDSARRLIGTISHPLNQPKWDLNKGRVTQGYGILQPRVSVSLESSRKTRFSEIFSGNTGLDPYTTAVSDIYQDLFLEGSYTGKGLYVVDTFIQALDGRVPENRLLSHDLFEGSFARSGLATDIELFDDYPSDYDTYSKRQHRWVRGDWQIAQWLFPKVPSAHQKSVKNNLSIISRWKILDNLRRSLVSTSLLIWLIASWTFLPGSSFWWTTLITAVFGFPIFASLTKSLLLTSRRDIPWRSQLAENWNDALEKVEQTILTIVFIPQQSWTQLDAIVRTLYRKIISKKKLLEWVTFAQVETSKNSQKESAWETLFPAPFLSLVLFFSLSKWRPESLLISSPFLILWLLNPFVKKYLKKPIPVKTEVLTKEQNQTYRLYARRIWHFFETFVTEKDHWLAPDNFQQDPQPVVAHRTSPTNIGLQLLSTVSAYDFGYIGFHEIFEKLEKTFSTLEKLPKLHGHFFNWYDTLTLEPLRPQYVSTVDSGNLAGHLIAVKQACEEILSHRGINPSSKNGLTDSLFILKEVAIRIEPRIDTTQSVTLSHLLQAIDASIQLVQSQEFPSENSSFSVLLEMVLHQLQEAKDISDVLIDKKEPENLSGIKEWITCIITQVHSFQYDYAAALDSHFVSIVERVKNIQKRCDEIISAMDFKFLIDEHRKIFSIGFNATDSRKDNSFYDLLASESRLASFVAIAKGDTYNEHWFRLGRRMTPLQGSRALISWTATMFEYLMPLLVMKRFPGTLLDQTYEAIVKRQIEYTEPFQIPWGISEAGYNARDLQLAYQYGPFGVAGLGLKRGLSDDLVISPYSTFLAAMVFPQKALANLNRLEKLGTLTQFGFFESIDYTPERLPKNQKYVILQSFMAHHQGMSLVAIDNVINQNTMQRRFHSDPRIMATELLLQEKTPRRVPLTRPRAEEVHASSSLRFSVASNPRVFIDVNLPTPRTQLLSNGSYSLMLTSAGSGYSRCKNLAVNRWKEDVTQDNWGTFFYIRNRTTGRLWSAAPQPLTAEMRNYEVTFAEDKVEIWRRHGQTQTHTEIIVAPEDNVELRRLSLTNGSMEVRDFDITSYMEVVLAKPQDDMAHPAFSNLFVQTDFLPAQNALLATRRPRSSKENPIWGFHVCSTEAETVGSIQYETDRSKFIGRGRSIANPFVVSENRPLSNTVGAVLDPIFSLRQIVRIQPGESARLCFATGVGNSREEVIRLLEKYRDPYIFSRESELAWTKSQVQLRHFNISSDKAHLFQRLASRIIYSDPSLRPRSYKLALNKKPQSSLWAYGISGDFPIVVAKITEEKDLALVRELFHAHEYLRFKGLSFDLVILNGHAPSYVQALQEELQRQVRMSGLVSLLDKPGGIFLRRTDIMPEEDVILINSVARVVLNASRGTLDELLIRRPLENKLPEEFNPILKPIQHRELPEVVPTLQFFNGLGGFEDGGRYYVTTLKEGQWTPAPWINVIANAHDFGFLISETGGGYTWSVNSRENRLTPWSNDAVSDPIGEAIYIRDEKTGAYWSTTPLPIREPETYIIKHSQGYTKFEHTSHSIVQQLHVFVPTEDSVKISRLVLKNIDEEARTLSITNYVEWVLGFSRSASAPYIVTELDSVTGALLAKNAYNNEFSTRISFVDMSEPERTYTCDRKEFIGRNRNLSKPAALENSKLSGSIGAGLDPCAAFQTQVELQPGESKEIIFVLGQAESIEKARLLIEKYRSKSNVKSAFQEVVAYWDETLGSLEIKTPDAAMNLLVNRWLLYQTLSCRFWARSAFYQSGGAYGFRDQLQDSMALVYSKPDLTREHILRAAARQFKEGDVQHWWHPPTGRGVRTRFSDDLLWLPYVVSFYTSVTGDTSILDEVIPFIEAPALREGEDDSYTQPSTSEETATVFEHCIRTLDRSLKVGAHGLPLMGSGDWNDGMNRVGNEGKGESVWVGWFLLSTLKNFLPHCIERDQKRAAIYQNHQKQILKAIEEYGWDGDWYRRAYFDNGQVLGSSTNQECRIDSIAQSWAVLSGEGNPQRAKRAMDCVDQYLIHREEGLIKLFTPPFDKSDMDPGYIKGYVPGVRENGGQYTHAAIWTVMAYAALKDAERANELFGLINPINNASTRSGLHKYKVEPYVVAADIYGIPPHGGRGGWTWYTGSSSWMYRAALESILGFSKVGNRLRINPCIPSAWKEFEIIYRDGKTTYQIKVLNREGHLTEKTQIAQEIALIDDGNTHDIVIEL